MNQPFSHDSLCRYPYPSRRSALLATGGVVATGQPLAAQAGIAVLADGGTAIDAAITTAAALTVLEPTSNGLGGDAFAIVWDGDQLHGLNASGRWPATARAEALRDAGHAKVPWRGWAPVTVPGAVDSWGVLHERFGRLPMTRLLQPAIDYAEHGYPVSPIVAHMWSGAYDAFTSLDIPDVADWETVFAPAGHTPGAGEMWSSPAIARGLRCLADNGPRDFYEGEVAAAIAGYAEQTGGLVTADDLASHHSEWVDPIGVRYGDYEVWEIPPSGQGIAALIALGMVAATDASTKPHIDPANWHIQIEAMKLAFADNDAFVADQQHVAVPVDGLLDPDYLAARADLIGEQAGAPSHGDPILGGTVYLSTADRNGQMVSFIQSNYAGFGSGVVVPSHGIALQNRGAGFSLDPDHPNVAAPGKRPLHTIIPGFLTRDGVGVGPFGVMGGEMQPQGHLQVIAGMIDHDLNPQATLDAPRWQVQRDGVVWVEANTPESVIDGLRERGHTVVVRTSRMEFGRGQIIVRSSNGVYAAGSEPRTDGCAIGF